MKQKTIRARVDRKTKDKLVKKAAKESSSESRLVRMAVLNYLIEPTPQSDHADLEYERWRLQKQSEAELNRRKQ